MNALSILEKHKKLNIPAIAERTITDNSEYIADRNAEQLAQGISADGKPTTLLGKTEYSPATINLKRQKSGLSSVTTRITGYDTGSLYRNLYAVVQGSQIEYGSKSETAPKFESLASNRIYGLTEENKQDFIENVLQPAFILEVERQIF